jgi:hypothetical protein
LDHKINEGEIVGACNTRWEDEKWVKIVGRKSEKRENLEEISIDGKVILEWI